MIPENGAYKPHFAFIPHRLQIEGRPELYDFPLNVLYLSFKRENGVDISGTALYRPDLTTFRTEEENRLLDYRNIYGPENLLVIRRCPESWEGEKYINGKKVLWANGGNWKQFFVHLTSSGLINGEKCKFEVVKPPGRINN